MEEFPSSASVVRQAAMKKALIKTTELIDKQFKATKEKERLKGLSQEERNRANLQNQISAAMGGGDEENDADAVLKMINGLAGMKYREIDEDGNILDDEAGDEADKKGVTPEDLLGELRAMREQQAASISALTSRMGALEAAVMRGAGLASSDPGFAASRSLSAGLDAWRGYSAHFGQLRIGLLRLMRHRLGRGWRSWLEFIVDRFRSQLVLRDAGGGEEGGGREYGPNVTVHV